MPSLPILPIHVAAIRSFFLMCIKTFLQTFCSDWDQAVPEGARLEALEKLTRRVRAPLRGS